MITCVPRRDNRWKLQVVIDFCIALHQIQPPLENKIEEYFPSMSIEEFDWICNPFLDLSIINLSNFELCEEEELASLSSDCGLNLKYTQLPLDTF